MKGAALLDELRARLGPTAVLTDPDLTAGQARDMMPLAESGAPLAVVRPADVAGVRHTVQACAAAGVPIVPRGAGSGMTGGANAVDGCVVLATTKLTKIVEIDRANRLAVVQAGVVNRDLRDAAAAHNLFYPPDPASSDWCTIGGNLATNAGGLCCVKYGVTTDSVLALQVVLADGSVLRTGRRTAKGVAGYDLARLFVGSEGTLGLITEATLSLRPLPQAPGTLVAAFAETHKAGAAVTEVVRAGVVPSLMEIMDAVAIRAAQEYLGADIGTPDCQALLLCQSDSGGDAARRELETIDKICAEGGAELTYLTWDLAEGNLLLQARRACLTALHQRGHCLSEDVAVPRTRIADLITCCARIGAEVGLTVAVVGHAGDGNMHPAILYDPDTDGGLDRARQAFDRILALALALGGTVTGEHGIGRAKREWLARELGPVGMRVHRDIKAALDPGNLFNPGAMFLATP